jgi:hypothetical protein
MEEGRWKMEATAKTGDALALSRLATYALRKKAREFRHGIHGKDTQ